MRIKLPEYKDKKDLHKYIIDNKLDLIEQKKSTPIIADCVSYGVSQVKNGDVMKANQPVEGNMDTLRVKVIANTANWIDSHFDMLLPDAPAKSISERKGIIPHLHDHIHQVEAKIGEVADIYLANYSFSELGIKGSGQTQGVTFITDVMKSYNEKIFNQYKLGKVNQHSIGLQYMKLDVAINDEESEKEFEFWERYYEQAINKEVADHWGFFWVIQEYKLIENSTVLFGSNEITPTLDNNVKSRESTPGVEPPAGTQNETDLLMFNF